MPSRTVTASRRKSLNPADRPPPDYLLHDPIQPPVNSISSSTYRSTTSYNTSKAIVIDFGTSTLRAGYSTQHEPYLQFPPLVARTRDMDTGNRGYLIGNDALISSARSTARSAYDTSGIPNNPAIMERLLDGTLYNLGLYDEDKINHNFVLTETPCTPNSARALIMEVLFEGYNTNGICFGIDALFSYYYNKPRYNNSVILSCGYNSTHVLPLVNSELYTNGIKRINLGGSKMTDQLQRRLQLLNNEHSNLFTTSRIEKLKEHLCYISNDYDNELKRLKQDVDFYNNINKSVRIPLIDSNNDKNNLSVEEQERQKQARIENGKRLSEMMRAKRQLNNANNNNNSSISDKTSPNNENNESNEFTQEEVKDLYESLKVWYDLQRVEEMKQLDEDKYYAALIIRKFNTPENFEKELEKLLMNVDKEREKLGGSDSLKVKNAEEQWWKRIYEDELLSMSDTDLNATELKKKRHIRALRGAAEARERIKKQKEVEKREKEKIENDLKQMKEERPQEYLNKLKNERQVLAGRIKKRQAAREAGSDRRSQAARERMRLLAHHAGNKGSVDEGANNGKQKTQRNGRASRSRAGTKGNGCAGAGKGAFGKNNSNENSNAGNGNNNNNNNGGGNRKGKRGGKGGGGGKDKDDDDDDFGWNDEDWDVYRSMKVGGGESDSEDHSSEEKERLEKLREEILEISPDDEDPTVSKPEGVALLYEENPYHDEISMCVDRLRTGELLFQPTLAGIEQCGLAEAVNLSITAVARSLSSGMCSYDDRANIVKEVFITGGVGKMEGFKERMCSELRKMLPSEQSEKVIKNVRLAQDATLDGWKGAAKFAESEGRQFQENCISKQEYEEMGAGYLKEHRYGNRFFPTPVLSAAELELKKKMQKQSSKRGRARGLV